MLPRTSPALVLTVALLNTPTAAQQVQDEDLAEVSYIYAAVMGTGTYKIRGRRITRVEVTRVE